MRSLSSDILCAYCGLPGADEKDHVIARQFFPPDHAYRAGLPQVPSCGTCNRKKQRVEDGPAVLFQFGDGSEASGRVLTERVPRTLAKNRRLHRSLRQGLQDVLIRLPSGIIVPGLGIRLSPRELNDSYAWFQFVTRGLYCFEFGGPLPVDHSIHILWPVDERFNVFTELILRDPAHQKRTFAWEEFRYAFASNRDEEISLWFYIFKSIQIFALTLSTTCLASIKASIAEIEWPPPDGTSLC